MAKIRIVGDSSGYVELAAPNAAGNNTLELPSNATKLVGADASNSLNVTGIATFSSGIAVSAGSTSAPSISPSGDSNTGIFFPSADTVCIGEGGTEVIRVNSSGYVGVGTANPLSKVHIQGTGNGSSGSTGLSDSSAASALLLKPIIDSGTALALGTRATGGHYIQGLYAASSVVSVRDVQINPYGGSVGIGTFADAFGGAPGNSTFVVGTTGVERLRIDSSGRVTMPYQPAFSASGANTNVNYSGGAIFQFNVADLNVGNHFDTSNYRFTAPVTGFYLFGAAIYVNGNLSACFTVNGSQVYGGADPQPLLFTNTTAITISGQIQLSLAAGDIVDFRSRDGSASNTIYMGHSNFWGRLVG